MDETSLLRYSRLIAVEGIGREGVDRLRMARVLVAGCGALGSMAAMQLAGSGVGHLRIADFDTIDISNLQRQFFYRTSETGMSKAEMLKERIGALNPEVGVEVIPEMLTRRNCNEIMDGCDFVVEATDNHASMLLIDEVCDAKGIPCVMAGISGFSGQVVGCMPGGRRYRDMFPATKDEDNGVLPCSMAGVAGPAAALAASIEAAEAIKHITGMGMSLADRMLVFDLDAMLFDIFET